MSFNFILWFFIALGIYLLVLLIICIVKKIKKKRRDKINEVLNSNDKKTD